MENNLQRYSLEAVAQAVEWINADVDRNPERYAGMVPEARVMWRALPAQVRAHRYPFVMLDPNRPLVDYLKSGYIGPLHTLHDTARWEGPNNG